MRVRSSRRADEDGDSHTWFGVWRLGRCLRSLALPLVLPACATTPAVSEPVPLDPEPQGDPTTTVIATLRLVNPRLACGVAALRFSRGDELLAVLGPDDQAELAVPIGRYVITVHDGRGALDHTVEVGPAGATLSPGCFPDPFHLGALNPLTLVGPAAACGTSSVRARAGGLLVELGIGERQTLYLPRATHIVRVLEDGKRGRDTTVDLTAGGAELELVHCAGAGASDPTP